MTATNMEELRKQVESLIGTHQQTVWGPSIVDGVVLKSGIYYVELREFGREPYTIKLEEWDNAVYSDDLADFQPSKHAQLQSLNDGDKVALNSGEIAVFNRLKRKKFIGFIDGQAYDIPVEMLREIVERIDIGEKEQEKEQVYQSLSKGDLFYINKNNQAVLFEFEALEKDKIIGKNLINHARTKIDPSLFEDKIAS